jgi:hypothetical protein
MATQIVMDHTGDTRHQFDSADAAAVAEAEVRFKELTGVGFTAAKRLDDGKSEVCLQLSVRGRVARARPGSSACL